MEQGIDSGRNWKIFTGVHKVAHILKLVVFHLPATFFLILLHHFAKTVKIFDPVSFAYLSEVIFKFEVFEDMVNLKPVSQLLSYSKCKLVKLSYNVVSLWAVCTKNHEFREQTVQFSIMNWNWRLWFHWTRNIFSFIFEVSMIGTKNMRQNWFFLCALTLFTFFKREEFT